MQDENLSTTSLINADSAGFEEAHLLMDVLESDEMMFSVEIYVSHRITRTICYYYEFEDSNTTHWILQEKDFFLKKGFFIFDIRWDEFNKNSYLVCDLNVTFNRRNNSPSLSILIFKKKISQVYEDLNVTFTKLHLLKKCELKMFEMKKQSYVIRHFLKPLYQSIIDYEECIREVNREHFDMELNYKLSSKMMKIIKYFRDDYKTIQVRYWILDKSENFTRKKLLEDYALINDIVIIYF